IAYSPADVQGSAGGVRNSPPCFFFRGQIFALGMMRELICAAPPPWSLFKIKISGPRARFLASPQKTPPPGFINTNHSEMRTRRYSSKVSTIEDKRGSGGHTTLQAILLQCRCGHLVH